MTDAEINERVAIEVLGWHWFHCKAETGVQRNQFCSKESAAHWREAGWMLTEIDSPPSDQFSDSTEMPNYSTDISAAMEVVEKMRGRELGWSLNDIHGRWSAELWEAEMTELASGIDESLPRAICLAALAALET